MREKIINQPTYWVEKINGELYEAIMEYFEGHNMKQKDLAEFLGISKGRISQIINEGDVNFRLEKIIDISLKIGRISYFIFEDKEEYLKQRELKTVNSY